MNHETPHERSLLMRVASALCRKAERHEGQRVVTWDEHDNLAEETPPCEDHIRLAETIRGPLSVAYKVGLQRGYEIAAGEQMPFLQLVSEKSPYNRPYYWDDFFSFEWDGGDQ